MYWFLKNPVAANLLALFLLLAGGLALSSMRIEGFPRLPADTVSVSTIYPNASAEQVEERVTRKIEDAITGIDGIKKINSVSANGFSQINVVRNPGHKLAQLRSDVRERLDSIYGLPADAERPVMESNDFDFPALYIVLAADKQQQLLQGSARKLKNQLLENPNISRVKIVGKKQAELVIGLKKKLLDSHELNRQQVFESIRQSVLNEGLGHLDTEAGRVFVKSNTRKDSAESYENIIVKNYADSDPIRLSDIADVRDGYRDDHIYVRTGNQDAIVLEILIAKKENLLEISKAVKQELSAYQHTASGKVEFYIFGDSSAYIQDRLNLLKSNAVQGLVIVFILLALFLQIKIAFWVAVGIPVALAGAVWSMGLNVLDYSINDITTFGVIVSLGTLVDDAVVVGESVYEHRQHSSDRFESTRFALEKVAVATTFGALTTIAAFSPLLLLDSAIGKILGTFSVVVILAVAFSLLESKFILPSHLMGDLDATPKGQLGSALKQWGKLQGFCKQALFRVRDKLYLPALQRLLKHRFSSFLLFFSLLVSCAYLVYQEHVKVVLFPDVPGDMIQFDIDFDAQFPPEQGLKVLSDIAREGTELSDALAQEHNVSQGPVKSIFYVMLGATKAQIFAELSPVEQREHFPQQEIVNRWRKRIGSPEGIDALRISASEDMAGGFELLLKGRDRDRLKQVAEKISDYMHRVEGVHSIKHSAQGQSPQLDIHASDMAFELGFTERSLADTVKSRLAGTEVYRFYRDTEEVRVWLKASDEERDSIADFVNMKISSEQQQEYDLSELAETQSGYASEGIERLNRANVIRIYAGLDKSRTSSEQLYRDVLGYFEREIHDEHPDVRLSAGGELEEGQSIKSRLKEAFYIAMFMIYVLIAIPLKSYVKPLIIISIVPFGAVGAIWGHMLMGLPVSLMSLFGLMALSGIIVNDSLVLVVRYNEHRDNGETSFEAARLACRDRFQAIFLTTVTTVLGLLPLMLETSEQAQYLIPAAVSLAFGELFGTAITLILIPLILVQKDEIAKRFQK